MCVGNGRSPYVFTVCLPGMSAESEQCDLQRPECGQCLKSSRQCAGYHRETVFLDQKHAVRQAEKPCSSAEVSREESKSPANANRAQQESSRRRSNVSKATVSSLTVNPQKQMQNHFIGQFIEVYLPDGEKRQGTGNRRPISYLSMAVKLPRPGEALSLALFALATARFGRMNNDSRLLAEGRLLYGKSLYELQKALWDRNAMYLQENLAATIALGTYEVRMKNVYCGLALAGLLILSLISLGL